MRLVYEDVRRMGWDWSWRLCVLTAGSTDDIPNHLSANPAIREEVQWIPEVDKVVCSYFFKIYPRISPIELFLGFTDHR